MVSKRRYNLYEVQVPDVELIRHNSLGCLQQQVPSLARTAVSGAFIKTICCKVIREFIEQLHSVPTNRLQSESFPDPPKT